MHDFFRQLPCKLTCFIFDHFLLLNKLFMSSLDTNRSTFWAGCRMAPSSSFSKPSPEWPTAKLTSPKNFPRRQGWAFPWNKAFHSWSIEKSSEFNDEIDWLKFSWAVITIMTKWKIIIYQIDALLKGYILTRKGIWFVHYCYDSW